MSTERERQPTPEDLSDLERDLILHCAAERAEAVYLIDVTTALAGLRKTLRGQWFDVKLLEPKQKEAHRETVKQVNKVLKRLFKEDLIDIGREDHCSEGLKRHHREIIESMRSGRYWRSSAQYKGQTPPLRVVEDHVAHHEQWAQVTDFNAAVRELGGKPDMIALTERGRQIADMLGAS